LEFPRQAVDRCYPLSGERVAIGRHSRSRGTTPEIDLADVDPGVSAVHAVLVTRSDGGWDLVDLGSTNGTTLADGPIAAHVPVPLADGSVVRLGAWTTITVSVDQSR
jgi:pSer/pThr/pTyr-binding forkhead associated (FHA) protein